MPAPAESFLRSEGAWAEANYASLYPARFIENTNTYMTVDKHVAPFSQSAKSYWHSPAELVFSGMEYEQTLPQNEDEYATFACDCIDPEEAEDMDNGNVCELLTQPFLDSQSILF
ncbi:hypothetical protein PO909_007973 [Leuciscus waleckii]